MLKGVQSFPELVPTASALPCGDFKVSFPAVSGTSSEARSAFQLQVQVKSDPDTALLHGLRSLPALGDLQGDPSQRADKCHPKLFKGLKALLAHGNSPFSSDTSLWQTLLPHQHICRTKISLPLPCAGPPSSQPHLIIERVPDLLTNKTFIQMTVALLYFC